MTSSYGFEGSIMIKTLQYFSLTMSYALTRQSWVPELVFYIHEAVFSVCVQLFVWVSDHNLLTPWPIWLKFRLGDSVATGMLLALFKHSEFSCLSFVGKTPGKAGFPIKLCYFGSKYSISDKCFHIYLTKNKIKSALKKLI